MATFTKQEDPDNARLLREVETALRESEARLKALAARVDASEAFEQWYRFELYPWLKSFAIFIPFVNPPELPD